VRITLGNYHVEPQSREARLWLVYYIVASWNTLSVTMFCLTVSMDAARRDRENPSSYWPSTILPKASTTQDIDAILLDFSEKKHLTKFPILAWYSNWIITASEIPHLAGWQIFSVATNRMFYLVVSCQLSHLSHPGCDRALSLALCYSWFTLMIYPTESAPQYGYSLMIVSCTVKFLTYTIQEHFKLILTSWQSSKMEKRLVDGV